MGEAQQQPLPLAGGGGLSSGVSLAMKALKPDIRVFLAEPRGADDTQVCTIVVVPWPCGLPAGSKLIRYL